MAYLRIVAALTLATTVVTGCADTATAEDCQALEAATARTIDIAIEAATGMSEAVFSMELPEAQDHYRDLDRVLRGFEDEAEDMLDACAPHKTAEELDALNDEVDEILSSWDEIQQWCYELVSTFGRVC